MLYRYSAAVRERFREPRHAGALAAGPATLTVRAGDLAEGRVLELSLRMTDAGRIAAARFRAYGCPATIAAGDWLCEWLQGRSLEEAAQFRARELERALALPADKVACAMLAERALRAALTSPAPEPEPNVSRRG
ncbi:MAG TPA: iron-sulfur cluster assembly scaffold protein [Candidatus Competibacteraceae bacterium]|nr:iron-sulfur cluster assembly scaffold protein [Candidatus Competibacteraceae bacterium]